MLNSSRLRMNTKYAVKLPETEQVHLRTLLGQGSAPTRQLTRARVLLKANQGDGGPGWTDAAIAGALDIHPATISRVRREYVTQGLRAALERTPPDRVYRRKADGALEAQMIAVACGAPPAGHARWTLRLLASELVRLEMVESLSYETVQRVLKQTGSSRG